MPTAAKTKADPADTAVGAEKERVATLESQVKDADAPDLTTGRIITSDERRLMSNVDEKKLSKEDKDALALDSRIVRIVSFTTQYAVEAASDEAAIEAVKRDPSKFPYSQPRVDVVSRAATSAFDFRTADEYTARAAATAKSEQERVEREAKATDAARAAAPLTPAHQHPTVVVAAPEKK